MREPIRPARLRVSLYAEQLEDRSVMSAVVPEFVSTGAYSVLDCSRRGTPCGYLATGSPGAPTCISGSGLFS